MVDLTLKLILAGSFGDEPTAQASALEPAIAGPLALKAALRDYNGGSHDGARDELVGQLTAEVHRIQHGRIASLAHPNIAGALRECSLRVRLSRKSARRPAALSGGRRATDSRP
jgi:hypothetical protein